MELRSRKPIERITIKELAELAYINKATFYSHYNDIYDLSEQLENETINRIISNIPHPEELISKPKETTQTLAVAFISQGRLIDILFSGSRASALLTEFEKQIKKRIFLSKSKEADTQELIDIVGKVSERMLLPNVTNNRQISKKL